MKKILRKSLSVLLSALMLLAAVPAFVFAAEEATTLIPVIALEKVSETETEVVVSISLKENSLSCLDLQVDAADDLTLTLIEVNSSFNVSSCNTDNGMISIAVLDGCTAPLDIATYTYTKSNAEGVIAEDFSITVTACYVSSDDENGEDVTDSVLPSIDVPEEHSHIGGDEWVVTTPSVCDKEGEETLYCTECGEVAQTRPVEKAEHKNTTSLHLDPTCDEDGYDKVFCVDCETYISETVILATGHLDTSLEKKLPTCTEDGYVKEVCSCGEVVNNETILSSGHNYITDIKNATCEEDGYVQEICIVCRDIKATSSLKAHGHYWLDWEIVKEPTVSAEGVERKVCDNCGIDEERSVAKLVIPATELVMSMAEITMNFKQTSRLFVNVLPEDAAYSTEVIWESSNPEVATVNEDGEVYATGLGTATITATTADGTISASCEVTVKYSILQWIIVYILFGWIWYV